MNPVSNETLSVQIDNVKKLLEQLRDRDIAGIYSRLDLINGRERENREDIGGNRGSILVLQQRVTTVEEDVNRKTAIVGIASFLQAIIAGVASYFAPRP